MSSWTETRIEDQLPSQGSWVAERGILKYFVYVYKTKTFHLFTTQKSLRTFLNKLQGKKKKLEGVRRGRFIKPLLFWGGPFFIQKKKTSKPRTISNKSKTTKRIKRTKK